MEKAMQFLKRVLIDALKRAAILFVAVYFISDLSLIVAGLVVMIFVIPGWFYRLVFMADNEKDIPYGSDMYRTLGVDKDSPHSCGQVYHEREAKDVK